MEDYRPSELDNNEMAAVLEGFGSKVGAFNMVGFREQVAQRITNVPAKGPRAVIHTEFGGASLGAGYCSGVCLDWARRILLTPDTEARQSQREFLSYAYDSIRAGQGAGRHDLNTSKGRAYQTVGRMAQAWSDLKKPLWDEVAPAPGTVPGTKTFAVEDPTWTDLAAGLDKGFEQSRKEAGRAKSTKPFAQMVLLGSKRGTYAGSKAAFGEILKQACRPGAVTKLGFDREGGNGHAVAIWQRRVEVDTPDAFYFFDPSFGVFSYARKGLVQGLRVLFYTEENKIIPRYVDCVSKDAQKINYVLFGPVKVVSAAKPSARGAAPPAATGPVNPFSPAAAGLPTPGVSVELAGSAPTTPPVKLGLRAQLEKALADTSKHLEKFNGRSVQGDWVTIPFQAGEGLKREGYAQYLQGKTPEGEYVIGKSHLQEALKDSDIKN